MSDIENDNPSTNTNGKRINALELGPRKKAYVIQLFKPQLSDTIISCKGDPLVHHGRHFCWTIHALCNIYALLMQSVIRETERSEYTDEDLTAECVVVISRA